jgi:hypothetical protein
VRVLIADEHVGRGDKVAWLGLDRYRSAELLITAGIAANGVDSAVLHDSTGRHEAPVESNAFLHVAEAPEVGQQVRQVWARTAAGLVAVPYTPVLSVFGAEGAPRAAPPAPPVERAVTGLRIGWLEAREKRGEPLDVIPQRFRHIPAPPGLGLRPWTFPGPNSVFGRVVTPDSTRSFRVALALAALSPGGPVERVCTLTFTRTDGGSSGCLRYPGFGAGDEPFNYSGGGEGAFTTIDGIAGDDVARLEVLLADGTTLDVPLADNAFIVDVPRSGLPGRVVAYDSEGRVISSRHTLEVGSACCVSYGPGEPAPGKPRLLWRAEGPARSYAELFVGPSTLGDECMYLKVDLPRTYRGPSIQCAWKPLALSPVQVTAGWRGGWRFVNGRVREDVKTVRIRFGDGFTVMLRPRRGYVLYALPTDRLRGERRAVAAEGLDASGRVVGRRAFPKRFR